MRQQDGLSKLTLVIGGARSGKSRYAESLIATLPPPWAYVATAEAGDEEMAARIKVHRDRRGQSWRTIEAPRELPAALAACQTMPVLVDCLTLWLSTHACGRGYRGGNPSPGAGIGGSERRSFWSRTKWDLASCRIIRSAGNSVICRACSTSASPRAPTASSSWSRACRSSSKNTLGGAMNEPIDKAEAERHRAKMAKRKAVQDAEVAGKTVEKGLLIVHTGTGKGKSTAAFGLALRMLGRGQRVGVVQFIKGAWHSAERDALLKFGDQIVWHTMGEGFTWETQDRARDVAAAERAWSKARELMADPSFALVVLDELNIALRYDYLDLDEVIAALAGRRPGLHIVVTGRNAKPELLAAADLVTEMTLIKHHFAAGVKAQPGIEF